jgi:putative membrane protein
MMWSSSFVAYLHYASFMLIFGALAVEGVTLKPTLSLQDAWKIAIADGVYGLSATLVLITGVLRVLYFGKGSHYYLSNPIFYIKVALFLVIGTLSLYPTFSFLTWIKNLRQGKSPELEPPQVHRLSWIIRLELFGFLLIPLMAALMARGVGRVG